MRRSLLLIAQLLLGQTELARSALRGCCLLAVGVLLAPAPAPAEDEDFPSLEEIHAAYVEVVTSIYSIRCEYTLDWELSPENENPRVLDDPYTRHEIVDIKSHERQALIVDAYKQGKAAHKRTTAKYDGELYSSFFESIKSEFGPVLPPSGQVSAERKSATVIRALPGWEEFFGYDLRGGFGIADLLGRRNTRILGREAVNGVPCFHVDLGRHRTNEHLDNLGAHSIVWLDPSEHYLPRRILVEATFENGNQSIRDLYVDAFADLPVDPSGGRLIPFPASGYIDNKYTLIRYTLSDAKLNVPVAEAEFRASFPHGTKVHRALPGKPVEVFWVGGAEAREAWFAADREAQAARGILSDSSPAAAGTVPSAISGSPGGGPSARPADARTNLPAWAIVIGLLCLAGAWQAWRRQTSS